MKKIIKRVPISLNEQYLKYLPEKSVFFDIETTGFTAKKSQLYLIGIVYPTEHDGVFECQQFLNDDSDEQAILHQFFETIKNFKNVIHFNGIGFDIPFIMAKCALYGLPYNFDHQANHDLYKESASLKNFIKQENLKQKTIEKFLGIHREDQYSGGELINIYYDYLKEKNEEKEQLLLLHNLEDICGMVQLLSLRSYADILQGAFSFDSYKINSYQNYLGQKKKELLITLHLETPVPQKISGNFDSFFFMMEQTICKFKITIYTGELKFFYPDYKNYYYLPEEDMAIHKSVAFYVDKDFRTQAKAANCYSRKTGMFLPEYADVICPYFKKEYSDKIMYFEADEKFFSSEENIKRYVLHILNMIEKKK
ncbi:MAG: ribonuclease H-like domain-containing protein [Lachnospiraceae bacterium]|nr:ribonuclease H-like domain-containing protein [Lachnospiraceae bacterium]